LRTEQRCLPTNRHDWFWVSNTSAAVCTTYLTLMPILSRISDMRRQVRKPFPQATRQMEALGERLRVARLRRRLTGVLFAERMGVSRDTLHRLEKGDPGISLGTYLRALRVLGLDADIELVARDDILGRQLQDQRLPQRRRSSGATSTKEPYRDSNRP
jgi:transcriptional regulator with XRE-family HTH domain